MASKIHKQRTGKALKISREIVMREEMYEEEDNEVPRGFRALAANPQGSALSQTAIPPNADVAKLAHQAEIDRRFAEQFPNLQLSRRLGPAQPGFRPSLHPVPPPPPRLQTSPTNTRYQRGRTASLSEASPLTPPVPYPLPPTPESRSVSPVTMRSSSARPESARSDPLPAAADAPGEQQPAPRRWTTAGIPDDPALQLPAFEMPPDPLPMTWELPLQPVAPSASVDMTNSFAEFTLSGSGSDEGMMDNMSAAADPGYPQDPYYAYHPDTPMQFVFPDPASWYRDMTDMQTKRGGDDNFATSLEAFTFHATENTASVVTAAAISPRQSPTGSPVPPAAEGAGSATPSESWAAWLNIDDDLGPPAPAQGPVAPPLAGTELSIEVASPRV